MPFTIFLPLIRLQKEMDQAVPALDVTGQDRQIAETFGREQNRLRRFIRKRVGDIDDAEDILRVCLTSSQRKRD